MLKLPTFDMYNCFAVRIYACCTIFVKLCSGIVAIQVQFPFDKNEKHLSLLQMHGTNNKYKYPKKMKCHFYEFRLHHQITYVTVVVDDGQQNSSMLLCKAFSDLGIQITHEFSFISSMSLCNVHCTYTPFYT